MRSTFKVLFYLKRNKEKTQSVVPLMGRITVNGTISQFSAKLSVPERLWEVRGGRAKGRSLEADRINRYLDDIRSQIDRHYRDIRDRESYVTAEKVKNAWLGFGKRYRTLLSTFRSFTEDLHGRIGVDRSKNTWYRYLATMKHLQAFLTAKYRVSDIALAELEQSFIEQFHVYLKTERALKLTSICRYLDCLINVVKIAFNDGIMPRNPFASYRYNEPAPERAFLNETEILTLQHAALRTRKQRVIRDLFLFSCFTGICYADLKTLAWKQFGQDTHGDWWVTGNRCKTDTQYVVKLLPAALSILERYRDGADRVFAFMPHLNTVDRSLKRIAVLCGIDKKLTFHCARHTYATTICLMNGVSLETLSKMLGHKRITTTQTYAKVTQPMIDREVEMLKEKLADKFMAV
ncbi:site-specific integrase [Alistipes shahii]|uniref:site-specific integrase n=1 Tax=Alistipes shahii TaxID=328814 RepID=UPI00307A4F79